MHVESLSIKGLRGFAREQTLTLAQPDPESLGSGLTILVGPNNGGKSTVLDALRALSDRGDASFAEGMRNKTVGDRVNVRVRTTMGDEHTLRTIDHGGSETTRDGTNSPPTDFFSLPSRRYFDPYFGGRGQGARGSYSSARGLQMQRSQPIDNFSNRLFKALGDDEFRRVFGQIAGEALEWTMEQSRAGQYYVKVNYGPHSHSSDGLGDGLVSLLFVVDALYDSEPGALIAIDEPEVSLHPAFQRRLLRLIAEYAVDRQIVIATHSPYFVDFEYVQSGAQVARVSRHDNASVISQLSSATAMEVCKLRGNSQNPHQLGLDAREAFFREDGVLVVEGQDDVVLYPQVLDQLVCRKLLEREASVDLRERFFGWGAGGATNVEKIVAVLHELGFQRVAGVFDRNEASVSTELGRRYPNYHFDVIPADDVRTKKERTPIVEGLLDEDGIVRTEMQSEAAEVFRRAHEYFVTA